MNIFFKKILLKFFCPWSAGKISGKARPVPFESAGLISFWRRLYSLSRTASAPSKSLNFLLEYFMIGFERVKIIRIFIFIKYFYRLQKMLDQPTGDWFDYFLHLQEMHTLNRCFLEFLHIVKDIYQLFGF